MSVRPPPSPKDATNYTDDTALQFLDGVRDVAFLLVNPEGSILRWNGGASGIFGYAPSEIIGKHLGCLFDSYQGERSDLELAFSGAARGRPFNEDRKLIRRDGSDFWANVNISAATNSNEDVESYSVTIFDITHRKAEEGRQRLMVDLALNAMVVVIPNGTIAVVNPQTEKLFGYSQGELVGQPIEILIPESFRSQHPHYRAQFFANPVVREMGAGRDLRGRHKDGSEFPVEIGLNPITTDEGTSVVCSIVDITERQRAEERFRLAVESAPNAMVMVDNRGQIVLVNLQTERLFHYRRDELLGQPVELLVPDRFRIRHPHFRAAFFDRPTTRAMGAGRELFGRRKDGSEFPVEIGLTPIETTEGLLVLSAIVDITERQQLSQRSHQHLAELAHAGRLSTIGEMFSGLAHEINQPLAAACNFARACVRFAKSGEGATQEQLIGWMEKTAVQAERAANIVTRLGNFVRKESASRTPLNINQLIENVVALPLIDARPTEMFRVVPHLELDPELPMVLGEKVQIEQVLINLIRNAFEAMAEKPADEQLLIIHTAKQANFVEIRVSDNGHGIFADDMVKLFEPFFSKKAHGMGLGLSISRSIVESHDGKLTASNNPCGGATFTFSLPIPKEKGKL